MIKKIKSFVSRIGRRGKALICGALAVASSCAMAAIASAEDVTSGSTGLDMESLMSQAGQSLQDSLMALVKTMIPVVLGVMSAGLVIFGIMALIRLVKKVFGKVAG